MKLFKYISFAMAASFLLFSCADEDLEPIATFDNSGKGAYARLVEVTSGADGYNLSQFGSTSYDYEVEFVTLDKQPLVDKYDIFVTFQDNSPQNGDASKAEVLYKSFGAADFSTSAAGFQGISVSIPLAEVSSTLGLGEADLAGADAFNFRSTITLNDGRVFSFDNSSGAINGSAFAGHFNFSAKLSCPMPDTDFVGNYTLEYVNAQFPFGAETFGPDGSTVTLEVVSTTKRKFSAVYLPGLGIGNGPVDFVFELLCTIVIPDGNQGSGLGCGSGSITLGAPDNFSNFDITDDSVLEFDFVEFEADGGCGVDPLVQTIRLTKQ